MLAVDAAKNWIEGIKLSEDNFNVFPTNLTSSSIISWMSPLSETFNSRLVANGLPNLTKWFEAIKFLAIPRTNADLPLNGSHDPIRKVLLIN